MDHLFGKVLVVDDSEINRSILSDMLGDRYEVIEAEDGQAAVDIMRGRKDEISLVVLDIVMPNLDGFGVLDVMNREGWILDVPVVVVSSDTNPKHIARAYEMGVTDFIMRPFNTDIVRHRTVNTMLLWAKQRKLFELASSLPDSQGKAVRRQIGSVEAGNMLDAIYGATEATVSERTLSLVEQERLKYKFFASLTGDIQFEYKFQPPVLTVFGGEADKLGLPETIRDPVHDGRCTAAMSADDIHTLSGILRSTSPNCPVAEYDFQMNLDGEKRWNRIVARAVWSDDDPPRYMGAAGKSMDVHDFRMRLESLEQLAATDALTGLLNRTGSIERIKERMAERPEGKFAVLMLDMDRFKQANDTYGHAFGDEVLRHMADRIRSAVRGGDIAVRIGGDEFLIFLEYKGELEPVVKRIYDKLSGGSYKGFEISVSMGAASSEKAGLDYDAIAKMADDRLYDVKRSGRGKYAV